MANSSMAGASSGTDRVIGVATCSRIDLIAAFGDSFAEHAPQLQLLLPEQVTDPEKVEFMLTFWPADDAFTHYPNLKAVFSIGAGVDAILACPSLPGDLPVFRVEDHDQARQMAAFAVFHVVWHHRNMAAYLEQQARAQWHRPAWGRSPIGVRVGVMGFGNMGRAVAESLTGLGYDVATLSRSAPDPVPGMTHFTDDRRADFLARSDILINILPMTDATKGILNADLFAALPKGAVLIHLGRGAQLDEAALLAALNSGQLRAASLDVFPVEPLPQNSPFWAHPSVFVTPHTACEAEPAAVVRSVRDGLAQVARGEALPDRTARGY